MVDGKIDGRYRDNRGRVRLACFDLVGTLVYPTDGTEYLGSRQNMDWAFDGVPEVLTWYKDQGYILCVFSNHSYLLGLEACVKSLASMLPIVILAAANRSMYAKPKPYMYDIVLKALSITRESVSKESFYCGDRASKDHPHPLFRSETCADEAFAKAIGLPYKVPTDIFHSFDPPSLIPEACGEQEMIILVGAHGSGKTSMISHMVRDYSHYTIISPPEGFPESSKGYAEKIQMLLTYKRSVIVDGTHGTKQSRLFYSQFKVKKRVFWFARPPYMNRHREKPANQKQLSNYSICFEMPSEDEGYKMVRVC